MRYAVISKGLALPQMETECLRAGATNIRKAPTLGQLFCDLDADQARSLSKVPGLALKQENVVKADQVAVVSEAPEVSLTDVFYELRDSLYPAVVGLGLTCAVPDTGIRKTHLRLKDKVVFEANFSESETADDVFGHGTSVAYVIAGGVHSPGEESGVAPGAHLMSLKVLGDDGVGTDETVVMGIEEACELVEKAWIEGLSVTDPMYPNILNMSFGTPDDGDTDNPIRVACRRAVRDFGLEVIVSCGNEGPHPSSVKIPACDPDVVAVGAIEPPFAIWEKSSRGPTMEGDIKPDFVFWGVNLRTASAESDESFTTRTGTSFSCPVFCGITGLLWEMGRRVYGEGWHLSWRDIKQIAPFFCVKPEEAPLKKDNTYGYGLISLGPMFQSLTGPAPSSYAEAMDFMGGMFSLGLVAAIIPGMVRT